MSADLERAAWPAPALGDAIEALALRAGLGSRQLDAPAPADDALPAFIETRAAALGLDADQTALAWPELRKLLHCGGPLIARLPVAEPARFLVVLRGGATKLKLLAPDHAVREVATAAVESALGGARALDAAREAESLLDLASVKGVRRAGAQAKLVSERLASHWLQDLWLISVSPRSRLAVQAREAGLARRAATFLAAFAAQHALWLLAWWMIGTAALEGQLEPSWLLAWGLVLATILPLKLAASRAAGALAVAAGGLLKKRLLAGALALDPEEVRSEGAGKLLGRVLEAEAVESLALSGGLLATLALLELAMATVVVALGAGGFLAAIVVPAWAALALLMAFDYARKRRAWTAGRIAMTQELVERMAGHRTRLTQEPPERWHAGEDQDLERSLRLATRMDESAARLGVLIPRGVIVAGLAALAPAFVRGTATTASLAVGIGGVLLAYQALARLSLALTHLAGAALAWEQVKPLATAASRPQLLGSATAAALVPRGGGSALLDIDGLVYSHRGRAEAVLSGLKLRMRRGGRVLLEGPSGAGKSTLAALVAGLREPRSGLILLDGLDMKTLGARGWRRRVASAPQFHENHVLTGTLAFNLLMGRRWPPFPEDVREAEELCRELGLGPLLERMPSGLFQVVGDTGWRLSHGEQSRVFLARALLQKAELVVLDESFAALDPETLAAALGCALRRAPTLMVIAHP